MKTEAWNTGAAYTKAGQRIGVAIQADGSLVFSDVDRMIDGFVPADFRPEASVKERVKRAYFHSEVEYWLGYYDFEGFAAAAQIAHAAAHAVSPTARKGW